MTAILLVGLMVASAVVFAITWIEPRLLGRPAALEGRRPATWDGGQPGVPQGLRQGAQRRLGPVPPGSVRTAESGLPGGAPAGSERHAA